MIDVRVGGEVIILGGVFRILWRARASKGTIDSVMAVWKRDATRDRNTVISRI